MSPAHNCSVLLKMLFMYCYVTADNRMCIREQRLMLYDMCVCVCTVYTYSFLAVKNRGLL